MAPADAFTSDTVGDARRRPRVKPNAKQTNVGGDFPHMFDISSGGARVLVFTDKEQDTPAVMEVNGEDPRGRYSRGGSMLSLWVSPVMVGQPSRVPTT